MTRLIAACRPCLRPIVITALATGMRRGEILGLKWSSVDLDAGIIIWSDTKNGRRRSLPISVALSGTLLECRRNSAGEYVFCNERREPIRDNRNVDKMFRKALVLAEISDFRFHDLRHTAASHLVMEGADLVTVKEILGHRSLSMTLRYAHLSLAHKRKAVELLGQKFDSFVKKDAEARPPRPETPETSTETGDTTSRQNIFGPVLGKPDVADTIH